MFDGLDLHDSLLERVSLGPRRELRLDVFIPDVGTATARSAQRPGKRLSIRFGDIENYANVERFFFGGPLKGQDGYLDEIVEMKQTRVGWSLELDRRGRVAIKTRKLPTIESTPAGAYSGDRERQFRGS